MRRLKILVTLSLGMWALFVAINSIPVSAQRFENHMDLVDDCDPRIGAGWNTPTDMTGCIRDGGSVSRPEFAAFLLSPLSLSVVGHPSWTISPTYLTAVPGGELTVRNTGGRGHTFTEVADFGGGFVGVVPPIPNPPPLNTGLVTAPECLEATDDVLAPRDQITVNGLAEGNHKFMCCIHPWMRAVIKVQAEE
jgi:hypothetical protein